jgi:hypothetical protein
MGIHQCWAGAGERQGCVQVWGLERLWSGFSLAPERQLPATLPAGCSGGNPTCYAWAPEVRARNGRAVYLHSNK